MSEHSPGNEQAQLDFIFWRHIPQNEQAMLDSLEEADAILLESHPQQKKRDKLIQEAVLNKVLGGELTAREKGVLNFEFGKYADRVNYQSVKELLPGILGGVEIAIADKYHDSGKIVRLLDANPDDYPEISQRLDEDVTPFAVSSFEDFTTKTLERIKETNGIHNLSERDPVIIDQIKRHREAFEDKKIVVVYGANHTAISHPFIKKGEAKRRFIGSERGHKPVKVRYSIDSMVVRTVGFGKDLNEDLIDRLAVKSILFTQFFGARQEEDLSKLQQELRSYQNDAISVSDQASQAALAISSEELDRFKTVFDEATKSPSEQTKQKLHEFVRLLLSLG
jgi:hypothetical protein